MESLKRLNQNSSEAELEKCLTTSILESGLGLRDWAKESGKSIAATYDTVLKELANCDRLRKDILESIDHSAARVFFDTGDPDFDRFVGTTLAMQTLARGMSKKDVLECLSVELLDPFLELHQRKCVTRAWLSSLMANRYKSQRRMYRFGELARIALLVAALLGYHDGDSIFVWAVENHLGIEGSTLQQWTRSIVDVFAGDGYPRFEFQLERHGEKEIVRKVDTEGGIRLHISVESP